MIKKAAVVVLSGLILIVTVAVFIYPTPYRFFKIGDNNVPIKYNIITGKTYLYSPTSGWLDRTYGSEGN